MRGRVIGPVTGARDDERLVTSRDEDIRWRKQKTAILIHRSNVCLSLSLSVYIKQKRM